MEIVMLFAALSTATGMAGGKTLATTASQQPNMEQCKSSAAFYLDTVKDGGMMLIERGSVRCVRFVDGKAVENVLVFVAPKRREQ